MILSAAESLEKFKKNQAILVDIREAYELELVPCPNAQHLVMGEVLQQLDFFKAGQAYVMLCKTGKRAGSLAQMLSLYKSDCTFYAVDGGVFALLAEQNITFDEY